MIILKIIIIIIKGEGSSSSAAGDEPVVEAKWLVSEQLIERGAAKTCRVPSDAKIGAWIRVTGNEQSFNGTQSSEGIVSADWHVESSEEERLDAHSSEGPATDLNLRLNLH